MFLEAPLESYIIFIAFSLIIIVSILQLVFISYKKSQLKKNVFSKKPIYYKDFEKNWISVKNGRKGVAGYKYVDGPGCYVIMIFDKKVKDEEFKGYQNIYIGQSVNVCKRVHNHFNGKGNGDVYADIKYGKEAYVQILRCSKPNMNHLEKKLIHAFDATKSYNNTRGGGKRYTS